jgi:hypothetical protein
LLKKPEEIARMPFMTDEDFRRKAGIVRRLSSGLRSEAAEQLGLTKSEMAVINDAVQLLERVATAYKKAEQFAKKQRDDVRLREEVARACMAGTFAALSDPVDQVALIGTVQAWQLSQRFDLRLELERIFQDTLSVIAQQAARRTEGTVPENMEFYWAAFQGRRLELREKYGKYLKGADGV